VLHDEGMIPKKAMLRQPARSSCQVGRQLAAQLALRSKTH
jgi:hypothetical protein